MRHVLNYLTWAAAFFFFAPTVMAVASWSSLPGDPLYSVKLTLEDAAFTLLSPSDEARGALSVKRTERRFAEASRLLSDKASVKGLTYVDQQVITTKEVIAQAKDQKTQTALAQDYIVSLNTMAASLEMQKQTLVASSGKSTNMVTRVRTNNPVSVHNPTSAPVPTTGSKVSENVLPNTLVPTATPIPTQTSDPDIAQVVEQIEQTQQTIEETIAEMETVNTVTEPPFIPLTPTATLTPTPTLASPLDGTMYTAGAGRGAAAAAAGMGSPQEEESESLDRGREAVREERVRITPTSSPIPTPVPTDTPNPTNPPPTAVPTNSPEVSPSPAE